MTDRELLELAAKADGRDWKWVECPRYDCEIPGMLFHDGAHEVDYYFGWNPLEDDGDALRLAVKLGWIPDRVEFAGLAMSQDPYAATRRVIVEAAAAIGKAMK